MSETKLADFLKNAIFCKGVSDNNCQTYVGDVVGEPTAIKSAQKNGVLKHEGKDNDGMWVIVKNNVN